MVQRKRQYGSGYLKKTGRGWEIRWRENERAPDGTTKRVLRYQTLVQVTRREAANFLAQTVGAANRPKAIRSRVLFRDFVGEWQETVLPMYKHSTQKHRKFIAKKHLLPRFGKRQLSDITTQEIQGHVATLAQTGYAPKAIDHIHDVLSAILQTASKWGHLPENPARGVQMPKLKTVRPKWALTPSQATALLDELMPLPRTMVGLAILSGLRRGELFALRWKHVDEARRTLDVREAVYDSTFGTPKTEASERQLPLSGPAAELVATWRECASTTDPEALMFSTRAGKPLSPNNVLRRHVFPACVRLGIPKATWLTFRRTYASWSHDRGIPGKVVAKLMGHANADVTLNVYTQVLDESLRGAVEAVGGGLFRIVQKPEGPEGLVH